MKIVSGVQERDDYPYGSLKCKITFQVEFVDGKGFRWVTQTINPKNGRLNNPKKSTYSPFMVQYIDENGHNKPFSIGMTSYEDVKKLSDFFKEHPDVKFTDEESQDIWTSVISCIRGNALYTRRKEGVSVDEFLRATKVDKMIEMYGKHTPINEIVSLEYNLEEIFNLKIR